MNQASITKLVFIGIGLMLCFMVYQNFTTPHYRLNPEAVRLIEQQSWIDAEGKY